MSTKTCSGFINGGRSNGGVNLISEHATLLKLYTAVEEELATAASSTVTRYPAVKYAELECDTATRVEAVWTVADAISPVDPLNPTQAMAAKTVESIILHANAAVLSNSEGEGTTRLTNYLTYVTNSTSFMCKLSPQNAALRGTQNQKIQPIVSFVYTSGAEFGICMVSDVGGVAGSYSIRLFSKAKPNAAAKVVKRMPELISSQFLKKLGKSVTVFMTKHGDNGQLYSVCSCTMLLPCLQNASNPRGPITGIRDRHPSISR